MFIFYTIQFNKNSSDPNEPTSLKIKKIKQYRANETSLRNAFITKTGLNITTATFIFKYGLTRRLLLGFGILSHIYDEVSEAVKCDVHVECFAEV